MTDSAVMSETFGGFSLGNLRLALPMSALREVVACTELLDLPCPASCVIGGIALRGVVIPVVDLRLVLGRSASPAVGRSVVVMMHEAKVMGLLADTVTGIFEAQPGSARLVSVRDATAAVFLGGVQRADNQEMVSVLSAQALAALHQVPMVQDPEPARRQLEAGDEVDAAGPSVPMMLMLCGGSPLAVDAMLVHATLSQPRIASSVLAGGHCRGVIDYGGLQIPAVDLKSLCGLGRLDCAADLQAFVVAMPAGYVACLVSSVVDVVPTLPGDVTAVPAFALPRAELFAGALPLSALPADLAERNGAAAACQYLVIDADGLKSCEEMLSLAALNVADGVAFNGAQVSATTRCDGPERRAMITYMLSSERATPLDQVAEILAYQAGAETFQSDGALMGFMVDRGRSIPVLCLARLAGEPCVAPTAGTSVLVVESHGELIGFAVPALKTIEQADWEPVLPELQPPTSSSGACSALGRRLALVGEHQTERMLPLLDLRGMAASLQGLSGSAPRH